MPSGHLLQWDVLADLDIIDLLVTASNQFMPFISQDWVESFPELVGDFLPIVQQLPDGMSLMGAYGSLPAAPPVIIPLPVSSAFLGGASGPSSTVVSPSPGSPIVLSPLFGLGLSSLGVVMPGPGPHGLSPAFQPTAPLSQVTRAAHASPMVPCTSASVAVPTHVVPTAASSHAALPPMGSQSTQVITPPLMDWPPGWRMVYLSWLFTGFFNLSFF